MLLLTCVFCHEVGGGGEGGVYRVVSDMTGIESSDFQIDKFITLVKSCQVSMSCTTCLQ